MKKNLTRRNRKEQLRIVYTGVLKEITVKLIRWWYHRTYSEMVRNMVFK
jgi:hypothetical protein